MTKTGTRWPRPFKQEQLQVSKQRAKQSRMQQQQLAISRISKTVLVGNPMKQHVCKSIVAAIALASVSFLSGCASGLNTASTSDFACDESRNCPTPLEVYGRTNTVPSSVKNGRTPTSWQHTTPRKGDVKEGE